MTKKKKTSQKKTTNHKGLVTIDNENTQGEPQDLAGFPVVGIGASAGGLDAYRQLLRHLPVDTEMAYILIQHLDPHHESMLTDLLKDSTTMPVHEVEDNMEIKPNNVYIIPPNTNLGILHNTLQLVKREDKKGRFLPIDWFLRTLAEDRGSSGIGVILSGTASDGTMGLKELKTSGGITFAQDEASAEYYGMPGSAIAAGCVDFTLSPREIAREIGRIARHPYLLRERQGNAIGDEEGLLNKVFLLIRSRTGHDFTYYKHTTIKRRIKRRMLVHKLDRFSDYVRLLEQNTREVDALFQDTLINVTGFFRDEEVFETLQESLLPKLLNNRPAEAPLRIWVPGCATGEEAYSLAIVLQEYLGLQLNNTPVQIFATDIDGLAIEKARQGLYPERIAEEISSTRLKRFFVKVSGGYQISKAIRDMCVFAEQNVTKDPPFSKLDMISCRNLLIYLGAVLQKKVLQIFHYALLPKGVLMLGTSETIGSHADLFKLLDKKNKFYGKKTATVTVDYEFSPRFSSTDDQVTAITQQADYSPVFDLNQEADRLVISRYAPPGVVINHDMDILHFRGETGPYLNPTPGSASLNLLKMARRELVGELRTAVHKANKEGIVVSKEDIRLSSDSFVNLQVIPLSGPVIDERGLLVLFEELKLPFGGIQDQNETKVAPEQQDRIRELEEELITNREYMQSIIEDQEATNEELKSANEEIQSTNEELQSTNEELETAKEELQSTNEELATVNEELENRAIELGIVNNDLTNLLNNVNLPILMLDEGLRIRQFTPQAEKLLNLIEADVGRPISQIRANVEVPDLENQIIEVIETMATKSIEAKDKDGHWYNLRMRPYKTLDNRIEGAVITFIDIDNVKNTQRLHEILDNSTAVIYLKDASGRYQLINQRFEQVFEVSPDSVIGKADGELFSREYAAEITKHEKAVLKAKKPLEFEETVQKGNEEHTYLSIKFPLFDQSGNVTSLGSISTDITRRQKEAEKLRRMATIVRDSNDGITVQDLDGNILSWNPAAERIYGWSEKEAMQMNVKNLLSDESLLLYNRLIENVVTAQSQPPLELKCLNNKGATILIRLTASLLVDQNGKPKAIATTEQLMT